MSTRGFHLGYGGEDAPIADSATIIVVCVLPHYERGDNLLGSCDCRSPLLMCVYRYLFSVNLY